MSAHTDYVVAAVAGEPIDDQVIRGACRLAKALGASKVVVLHVIETSKLPLPPDTPEGKRFLDALRLRALDVTRRATELVELEGLEALPVIREGSACSEIADFIEVARADALVIGSSRDGGDLSSTALCIISRVDAHLLVIKKKAV